MSTDPSTTEQIAAAVLADEQVDALAVMTDNIANEDPYALDTLVGTIESWLDADRAHVAQQIAARLDDGLRAGVEALADEKESHFCRSMCGADAHRDDPDGCELMLISPAELRALLDQRGATP